MAKISPKSPDFSGVAASEVDAEEKDSNREPVDSLLEFILKSGAADKKIGEGGTGIVLEMDLRVLPQNIRESLLEFFPQLFETTAEGCSETGLALKIIKIYAKGRGQQECQMQSRAGEIIANSPLAQKVAVPRAVYHNLSIQSEQTQKLLASLGAKNLGQVEVIIMDRVEGDDFEVITYRELIRKEADKFRSKCPNGDVEDYISQIGREDLLALISSVYGHREAPQWDKFIKEKLRNSGIISQEEINALREVLRILHGAGFFHLDLHQGNLMRAEGRLFLIDFDKARQVDVLGVSGQSVLEIEKEVYESLNGDQRRDGQLVEFLESMVKKTNRYITEAQSLLKTIGDSRGKRVMTAWGKFEAALTGGQDLNEVSDDFIRAMDQDPLQLALDPVPKYKLALLLAAAQRGRREETIELSRAIREKNNSANVMASFAALEEFLTKDLISK
ncbi:MAG: hypothetical protein WC518_03035 [Patescibacteria group bacterium]